MQCRTVSQGRSSLGPEREIPNQCSTVGKASAIKKNTLTELKDCRCLNQPMAVLIHTHTQITNIVPQTKDQTRCSPKVPLPLPDAGFQSGLAPEREWTQRVLQWAQNGWLLKREMSQDGVGRIFPTRASQSGSPQNNTHKNTNNK